MGQETILTALAAAVVAGDEDQARAAAAAALDQGLDPREAIIGGLARGMEKVGRYFEQQRYFLPEVILSAEAFEAGVAVLSPHLPVTERKPVGVVLGTVAGDTHDIGKNLVGILLKAAGYEVHDLGRDVAANVFVEKVRETGAAGLGLSALMTTSMVQMGVVVQQLEQEGLRDGVRVLIGGAPVSDRYAEEIGADGVAPDAATAVDLARELLSDGQLVGVR
jgi:corrinoid protein of di/trimethylamine methyltransferase